MTSVLLAEDDASISDPLARALRREGYDVNVSADGPTTLDAALAGGIDLIVLDLGLPRLDGLEVCRRLHTEGFDLLSVLVNEAGKVVTREQIMREVWDSKWWGSTKTLDMHISWLRRKLGDDAQSPRYITTVRGVGFRFERGD